MNNFRHITKAQIERSKVFKDVQEFLQDDEVLSALLSLAGTDTEMCRTYNWSVQRLINAFTWRTSPQEWEYWNKVDNRLKEQEGYNAFIP